VRLLYFADDFQVIFLTDYRVSYLLIVLRFPSVYAKVLSLFRMSILLNNSVSVVVDNRLMFLLFQITKAYQDAGTNITVGSCTFTNGSIVTSVTLTQISGNAIDPNAVSTVVKNALSAVPIISSSFSVVAGSSTATLPIFECFSKEPKSDTIPVRTAFKYKQTFT